MDTDYSVSITRMKQAISEQLLTDKLKKYVKDNKIRVSQIIINKEMDDYQFFLTSLRYFYIIKKYKALKYKKSDVESVKFIKPVPHGEVLIALKNSDKLHLKNIVAGRAFDFIQDIKPKQITLSGYDNTIRGEFPQLLDPDHAEEIDKLRRWMQDGHISHYQYDDANPSYPKAGK